MPNWCTNRLTVRGDRNKILDFLEANKGLPPSYKLSEVEKKLFPDYERPTKKRFCFNALVSVPPDVVDIGYDGHNILARDDQRLDGYHWQSKYWGTKWDIYNDNVCPAFFDGYATLDFETAWAPPLAWLDRVARLFPELELALDYNEPGMAFAGRVEYSDGELSYEKVISGEEYLEEYGGYGDEEDEDEIE